MMLRTLLGMGPPNLDLAPGTPVSVNYRHRRSHDQKRYSRNMAYFHAAVAYAAELEAQHVPLPPELVAVVSHEQDVSEIDVKRRLGTIVFSPKSQHVLEDRLGRAECDHYEWQDHGVLMDPTVRSVRLFKDFILLYSLGCHHRLRQDVSTYRPPENTIAPVDMGIAVADLDEIIALSTTEPAPGMEGAVMTRTRQILRSLREKVVIARPSERVELMRDRYREPYPHTGVYVVERCIEGEDEFGHLRAEKAWSVMHADPWYAEPTVERLLTSLEPGAQYVAVEIPTEGLPLLKDLPVRTLHASYK